MNPKRLDDPALQSLEDQLAGLAPQLPAAEQQDLLYRCAFAAGRQAMMRPLRRWQAAAATLSVLLAVLCVPLVNSGNMVARHAPQLGPRAPAPDLAAAIVEPELSRPVVPPQRFDAWQVALSSADAVEKNLEELQGTDPDMQSLAMVSLTRAALEQ